jgi:hypothetical protein
MVPRYGTITKLPGNVPNELLVTLYNTNCVADGFGTCADARSYCPPPPP